MAAAGRGQAQGAASAAGALLISALITLVGSALQLNVGTTCCTWVRRVLLLLLAMSEGLALGPSFRACLLLCIMRYAPTLPLA